MAIEIIHLRNLLGNTGLSREVGRREKCLTCWNNASACQAISQIVGQFLRQQCTAHGCYALNQLQHLLRVGGKAELVLELVLSRLDEQGLEISSQWMTCEHDSIAKVLWQRLYKVAACTCVVSRFN
jgi:hypothetical protein